MQNENNLRGHFLHSLKFDYFLIMCESLCLEKELTLRSNEQNLFIFMQEAVEQICSSAASLRDLSEFS